VRYHPEEEDGLGRTSIEEAHRPGTVAHMAIKKPLQRQRFGGSPSEASSGKRFTRPHLNK
jgi:hypothetical protein